jgi:hypothetical protein
MSFAFNGNNQPRINTHLEMYDRKEKTKINNQKTLGERKFGRAKT